MCKDEKEKKIQQLLEVSILDEKSRNVFLELTKQVGIYNCLILNINRLKDDENYYLMMEEKKRREEKIIRCMFNLSSAYCGVYNSYILDRKINLKKSQERLTEVKKIVSYINEICTREINNQIY